MTIETVTQTVLRANEGYKLTNGTAFGSTVVLGVGDSPDYWHEITVEEYNEIIKKQEEASRSEELTALP